MCYIVFGSLVLDEQEGLSRVYIALPMFMIRILASIKVCWWNCISCVVWCVHILRISSFLIACHNFFVILWYISKVSFFIELFLYQNKEYFLLMKWLSFIYYVKSKR